MRKPSERLDAWEAYQRGLWHLHKSGWEETLTAQQFFCRAIALDANFAPGHYGYARALRQEFWLYSARSSLEVLNTAYAEARAAVSLDDKDAVAHAILAGASYMVGQWEAAIAEARTALSLNPNSAFVIGTLGAALCHGGYPEEAIDQLRRAMRASPHDPQTWQWILWIGISQFHAKDFPAALDTMREVMRLRPAHGSPHLYTVASLGYLGRLDEARRAADRAGAQFPDILRRVRQGSPWTRPENYAFTLAGLRLAGVEAG